MQTYGWDQGTIFASDTLQEIADPIEGKPAKYAGTMGESKRMEALRLNVELPESEKDAVIKVRAHVQTYGWDKEFTVVDTTGKETAVVGTTGASKRMEAVQISATGLKDYRILYRAHVQGIGWQDWVDASDPTSYAGTIAQSKRVEALEIAIVDADDYTYEHNNTQVGTHTVSYKGKVMGIEECAYGDWESETTGSLSLVRKCSLCGHEDEEKYTLSGALKDSLKNGGNGVVTVNNVTIDTTEELAVPTKNTLVVKNKLIVKGNLAVDGSIVANNVDVSNGTVKTNDGASFKVEGKYPNAAALAKFLGYDFLTGIEFFEGSGPQTISSTVKVTSKKLTVDLNETAVTFNGNNYMIENSGDLTINDGIFTSTTGKKGIETVGNLTINGGSIETGEQAVRLGETTPLNQIANKDIKDYNGVKVTLNEVELKTIDTGYGVVAIGNNANITLNDCKLDATGPALGTNNRTTGAGFTVNGGEITSTEGSVLAYLPAEGTNTFSGVKLTAAKAGIEVASGTLTLKNKTVLKASNSVALTPESLGTGAMTNGGYGVLVKLKAGYGKENGNMKVSIDNSTVTSEHDYAIAVVEDSEAKSKMDSVNVAITKSSITGGKVDSTRELPILTKVSEAVKDEGDVVTIPAVKVNISYTK